MSAIDDLVLLALVIAVAAVVIVAVLVLLYAWALRRQQEGREPAAEDGHHPVVEGDGPATAPPWEREGG